MARVNKGKSSMSNPPRSIVMAGTRLSSSMLESLHDALEEHSTLQSVRVVDLMDNELGSQQAQTLALWMEASKVVEVRLRFNNIGKEGCDGLASVVNVSTRLQVIDIRGNALSATHIRKLMRAISMSNTVTHLNLSLNKLEVEGAELVCQALAKNTFLQYLDLSSNDIGPRGATSIATMLSDSASALSTVLLHGNTFEQSGVQNVCVAMKQNKEIKRLTLGGNRATDAASGSVAEMLASNEVLLELDLRFNSVTAKGIQKIALEGLCNNCCLQFLCLSGNPIGPVGAAELVKALLMHTRSSVERLDLSSCALGPSGGARLANLLTVSMTLKELNLADNELDDDTAMLLAQAAANSLSLTTLDMSMNQVGEPGAESLLDTLQLNPHIVSLILHGNSINRVTQKKLDSILYERISHNRIEKLTNNGQLAEQRYGVLSCLECA